MVRTGRRKAVAIYVQTLILAVIGSRLLPAASHDQSTFGAFGPEGRRMREQLWILPSGDPQVTLRATVFRPAEAEDPRAKAYQFVASERESRRPLVIINHGTDESTRESVAMPVFYWLSRWFVERGYVVVVPQRRGHGATGGPLVEALDNCLAPDHLRAGQIAADDIESVLAYMTRQPFVDDQNAIVVGISSGGWASLALASRNPPGLRGVVNFAGGRGAYAGGVSGAVCSEERLIDAAGVLGKSAQVSTLWLYSSNDSYFAPQLAEAMQHAWSAQGGPAELHILPAYGREGHSIADDRAGWFLWGPIVSKFLDNGPDAKRPILLQQHADVRP